MPSLDFHQNLTLPMGSHHKINVNAHDLVVQRACEAFGVGSLASFIPAGFYGLKFVYDLISTPRFIPSLPSSMPGRKIIPFYGLFNPMWKHPLKASLYTTMFALLSTVISLKNCLGHYTYTVRHFFHSTDTDAAVYLDSNLCISLITNSVQSKHNMTEADNEVFQVTVPEHAYDIHWCKPIWHKIISNDTLSSAIASISRIASISFGTPDEYNDDISPADWQIELQSNANSTSLNLSSIEYEALNILQTEIQHGVRSCMQEEDEL